MTGRLRRFALMGVALVVVADLAAWGAHTRWRDARLEELTPLVAQMDTLATRISEADAWIGRRQGLLEGYGRHEEIAGRLRERGRLVVAHDALVVRYNQRVIALHRRFYVAPLAPPSPDLRTPIGR